MKYVDEVQANFISVLEEEANEPIVVGKIYTTNHFKFWKDSKGYYHTAKCIPHCEFDNVDNYAITFFRIERDGRLTIEGVNEYKSFDKAKEAYDKLGR